LLPTSASASENIKKFCTLNQASFAFVAINRQQPFLLPFLLAFLLLLPALLIFR